MNGDRESLKKSKSVQNATVHTGIQKEKLTQERLKELLSYDPETGEFRWKVEKGSKAKVGQIAGTYSHEYRTIRINRKSYLCHRLAWLYVYGYFPENNVDHINRISDDNRIVNLREATQQCNLRNILIPKHNTSGIKGVSKKSGRWVACICVNGRNIHLGSFLTKLGAVKERLAAEYKYGFADCISSEAELFVNSFGTNSATEERSRLAPAVSGVSGVRFKGGRWEASIFANAMYIYLGSYRTKLEAAKSRYAAEVKYGKVKLGETSAKKFIEEQANEDQGLGKW